jgi:hypothetical protein
MRKLLFLIALLCSAHSSSMTVIEYNSIVENVALYSEEVNDCATLFSCTSICVTKNVASEFRHLEVISNYGNTGVHLDILREANVINGGFQVCTSRLIEGVYRENQKTLERMP